MTGVSRNADEETKKYPGPLDIAPEQLTDEVFDYIFDRRDTIPEGTDIPPFALNELRSEFMYWYPVDIRVSGKDLIRNHLTMSLFNHAAIWPNKPEYWPKSFYANGHIMVDGLKMSKSTGNFITLAGGCQRFSADGLRMACADAGDTLSDANFSSTVAEQCILRLTAFETWAKDAVSQGKSEGGDKKSFMDLVFENEINYLVSATREKYADCKYKDALKFCWFDMENLRKTYENYQPEMNPALVRRFLKCQALMLSPVCPHFCENLWKNVLKEKTDITEENWPVQTAQVDLLARRKFDVLESALRSFRLSKESLAKDKKKTIDLSKLKRGVVYVAKEYRDWQKTILTFLQGVPLNEDESGPKDKSFIKELRDLPAFKDFAPEDMKKSLPFASFMMNDEMKIRGKQALELQLPFDERDVLAERVELIKAQLGIQEIIFVDTAEGKHPDDTSIKIQSAVPGKPQIAFME